MSVRFSLRDATHDRHEALDAHFAALDFEKREDYAAFLTAQAAAILPYEQALDHAGAAQVIPEFEASRRAPALLADLDALAVALPDPIAIQPLLGEPDILGASYVLEGSRLGAKMLVRGVADGLPTAFLSHQGGIGWKKFVALLEQKLASPVDRAVAERAALRTFDDFTRAAMSRRSV